jgi:hypothetical protein
MGAAGALLATEASAQPFCLRVGCESRPISHYASAADAPTGGALATTRWTRGLAQIDSGTVGLFVATLPTGAQPLPPRFATVVAAGFNAGGGPLDDRSPLAVGRAGSSDVMLVSNRSGAVVTGASPMTMPAIVSGQWSEPSIACSAMGCVGAVSDNDNRTALFFFDGFTVLSRPLSFGPVNAVVGVLMTRPAVVAIGPNRYLLVRRHVEGGADTLRVYDVDATRPMLPPLMVSESPPTSFQAGAPIVASAFGGSMIVGWAKQPSLSVHEFAAMAVTTQPSPGAMSTPAVLVRRTSPLAALGIARASGSYVVTWQEGPALFRMPLQSVPVGGDRYAVAHRPADVMFDRVAAVGMANSHRVASGPKALLVFDEMSEPGASATPRAMGYVMDSCSTRSDCVLNLGATWSGICVAGVCVSAPMDAGVDAGPDAGPDASVDSAMGVDAAPPMDAGSNVDASGMDVAAVDATASFDAPLGDSASSERDAIVVDGTAGDSGESAGLPRVTGGACGCRTGTPARSPVWPTLLAATAALAMMRRRRGRSCAT